MSKHWAQTVCVAPHFFTTPSPGGHSRQHSPLEVYWPVSQGSSTARSVFDADAKATWHTGTAGEYMRQRANFHTCTNTHTHICSAAVTRTYTAKQIDENCCQVSNLFLKSKHYRDSS